MTTDFNYMACIFQTTKQFLPSMLENNHGHIVNMGSSCGLVGISHLVDYRSGSSTLWLQFHMTQIPQLCG